MGWAALTSGGKDSILSIQRAIDSDMEVEYLVTIRPRNPDSYMFHSSNLDAVPVIAEVSGISYHEIRSEGKKEEELVELEAGIRDLPVEGIITGAVASEYQRQRIDRIAAKHAMKVFSPLWHMEPESLLREVAARMESIIVVTAAEGLDSHLLGARIDESFIKDLKMIASRYHIHLAGEGGEYESLTINAPFYSRPITYKTSEIHILADRSELVLGGFS